MAAVVRADIEAALRAIGADVKALRSASPSGSSGPERLYRQGSSLSKRVVGPNIYDLLLSDKTNTVQRLSTAEVRRRLDAAVRTGANMVRTHAWISVGKPDSLMPSLGVYNEAAFVALDVIMAEAKKRNLWLWAPVTDRWNFYHGGGVTFAQLVAGNTNQAESTYRNLFYNDAATIAAFKSYLTAVLTRTNTITGVKYVDDPTLAIIETINEGYDAPASWTSTILAHLRSIAPSTLLADGCNAASGRFPDGTNVVGNQDGANSLTQDCDIVGSHFYDVTTRDAAWLDKAAAMAVSGNKVFLVGEWGWNEAQNGSAAPPAGAMSRAAFCARMEANRNVSGDFYWSLFTDTGAMVHDDMYQIAVPPQNAEQAAGLDDLTMHAWNLREREGRLLAPAAAVATAFSDPFDGTTGSPVDATKWTTHLFGSGAAAVIAGNQLALSTGSAGGYGSKAVLRSLAPARADRRIAFTVSPNGNNNAEVYFRAQLRGQGAGADIDTGDAVVFEMDAYGNAGVKVRSGGQDSFARGSLPISGWGASVAVNVEFEVVGTAVSARWWLTTATRPTTAQWSANDAKIKVAGGVGLALNGGNSTANITWTVNDFVMTDITQPNPLDVMDLSSPQDVTGVKTFLPGALLMRHAQGKVATPWSTVTPPTDVTLTQEYATQANPPTPATGLAVFAKKRARVMPAIVDPKGHDVSLMPHMGTNKFYRWTPQASVATMVAEGLTLSVAGSTSAVTPTTGTMLSQTARLRYASSNTAGSAGVLKSIVALPFLGSSAGMGGFHQIMRFGFGGVAPVTGTRFFTGMVGSTGASIASADPSALTNSIGIGWNAADTPALNLITNDGSGTATKTAIPGFTGGVTVGELYEFHLYAPPGVTSAVDWALRAAGSGVLAQGTVTADVPTANTMMVPFISIANGALAAAYSFDCVSMTLETDN